MVTQVAWRQIHNFYWAHSYLVDGGKTYNNKYLKHSQVIFYLKKKKKINSVATVSILYKINSFTWYKQLIIRVEEMFYWL